MRAGRFFERVAAVAVRWPWLLIGIVVVLTAAGVYAATKLETSAGTDTLVDEDSEEVRATDRFHEQFGDEPVVVLARQDLRKLVLTEDLLRLFELESCFAGGTQLAEQLPQRPQKPLPEVCSEIADLAPSRAVFGPATFLYLSVAGIQQALQGQIGQASEAARQAAEQARRQAAQEGASDSEQEAAAQAAAQRILGSFQQSLIQIALEYGITRPPQLDDPEFVSKVVFDPAQPAGTPKERFGYLFPSNDTAQVIIRLRPDLTEAERARTVELFRKAIEDPRFRLSDGSYLMTGAPVLIEAGAKELESQLLLLLGVAAVVMALTLLFLLPPPLRLLPLGVAAAAGAMALGLVELLGPVSLFGVELVPGSLTVGTIATLPVLVGLSVDYAIQFQARFNESLSEGVPPGRAVATAAGRGGPVIGTACLATIVGFAVFALSPSPLVRSFGLLLVIGVALAFVVAMTAGLAALGLSAWRRERPARGEGRLRRLRRSASDWVRRGGTGAVAIAIARPGRVLAAGLVLAVCGWVASVDTEVETDIRELAPSDLQELRDLRTLERETGISGDINVVIRADDPTDPAVITWAQSFQQRVLERHGFSGANPTCEQAQICPAISLTDFFAGAPGGEIGDRARTLIESLPPFISQIVITRNPITGSVGDTANMAFGIRAQSLSDQQDLIEDVRAQVDPPDGAGPPDGTEVEVAGLPVIAAEANSDLDDSRWWLPPAGLLAVALVLLAIYRSYRRALVPLIPVLLATGWSGLVVAAMNVPLNPMSATLGALVIAVATEFSVILAARYERERAQDQSVGEALRRTYERTGSAVLASGLTAIAGFAVLAIAGLPFLDDLGLISVAPVLSDFGLVTVADLAVALIGVMLVLPAALVWAEEGFPRPSWARATTGPGAARPRDRAPGPVGPGAV